MLKIVPIFQKQAFQFITELHRHHIKPIGSVFQIAIAENGKIVGVAVCGRPVSRHLQNGLTLEVTRLCTDGTKNACSMLYSACWRIAKEMGYERLITYILNTESGISLKASGWNYVGERGSKKGWNVPSRPRIDKHPLIMKKLYEKRTKNQVSIST